MSTGLTEMLARSSAAHPWRVVAAWTIALVVSIVIVAALLGSALTSDIAQTNDPESERADALIAETFHDRLGRVDEVVIAPVERAAALADRLRATGVVASIGEPRPDESGQIALLTLTMDQRDDPEQTIDEVVAVVEAEPGATITGVYSADHDFQKLSEQDLQTGEFQFGMPAALIVLLLVFGAVVAALVPLMLAIVAIVVALALTALLGQAFELSFFVVNMLTGMGLALGIDYSLFVLSRFREERRRGFEKLEAIAAAGATSSRAVLFSGAAFVLAMLGMVLVPDLILRSLAAGAILVGVVAVLAALTLLPAVISLLGDRVNALRIPFVGRGEAEGAFWLRIVRGVMRRPLISLVAAVAILLAATIPVLDMERGFSGISTLPDRFASKQGFDAYVEAFGGGETDPASIVIRGGEPDDVEALAARIAADDAFGSPSVQERGDVTLLTAPVRGDAASERAVAAVERLREEYIPHAFPGDEAEVLVGGETAGNIDYFRMVDLWLPIVFAFVLGLSFVLLTLAFRSIVVAAKAVTLNLLSVGAAYGLLVLVFQKGIGNELFGFPQVETVEAWVPLFLFSVLFGLSMDYHVFLLSRIRERYVETGSNEGAVEYGVASTARLITGAALIIVAVFAGFARGDLVMFQQMGFGVAVSLLIDATIVRSVLVPAAMTLLGGRNWYLPRWLSWLPHVSVEGPPRKARAESTPALIS
ncbi:MAG: MMPL family transporter [Actinobacteria bacterium]|nr:MMPL family transporter [Actinomycetota bacterium]